MVSLQRFDHEVARVVDLWVKITVEGYIGEFTVEFKSFSRVEDKKLKRGACGRWIR
jgi:hypothetical protein